MRYKRIIAISVLLTQVITSLAQEGDDIYLKADCSIDIIRQAKDTIIAYGSPRCTNHEIDTALDGVWIVLSRIDSTTIVSKTFIKNKMRNGTEYILDAYNDNKFYINYKDGEMHGAFLQLTLDNKVKLFCDYTHGEPSGDYYYYSYTYTGKLFRISRYNRKGKLKKKEYFANEDYFPKK